MPAMDTISKVVLVPNEYKERMSKSRFSADSYTSTAAPQFHKPLIYVTRPDNMEEEIWVPPVEEDISGHSSDEDSDDGSCPCWGKYDGWEDGYYEKDTMKDSCSISSYDEATERTEMWFYRTGWQNRGVYATDDKTNMMYYVDIPWRGWGTSLTIRNGSSSGDVIAEINRKGPGIPFEITFSDRNQRPLVNDYGQLILKFGCEYSRIHKFTYCGRNLAWKSEHTTKRLQDLDTDEVIAEFYSKPLSIHKDGKLVILGEYGKDQMWVDVIVATALTYQQREREIRRRAANNGIGGGGGSF